MISPEELMQLAIAKTHEGIMAGQSPFGCAIARRDQVLAVSHNLVWATTDITAHAEVTALREACKTAGEILLEDSIVATTCEPCPMCIAALHWSRVKTVYFGATIADAGQAGFNELNVSAADLLRQGGSTVELKSGLLPAECVALFQTWKTAAGRAY